MEIVQDKIMTDMGKFRMWPLNEKSEIDCRIWESPFLFNQMIEESMIFKV